MKVGILVTCFLGDPPKGRLEMTFQTIPRIGESAFMSGKWWTVSSVHHEPVVRRPVRPTFADIDREDDESAPATHVYFKE